MATSATFRMNEGVDDLYNPRTGEVPPSAEEYIAMAAAEAQEEVEETVRNRETHGNDTVSPPPPLVPPLALSPPISEVDYRHMEPPSSASGRPTIMNPYLDAGQYQYPRRSDQHLNHEQHAFPLQNHETHSYPHYDDRAVPPQGSALPHGDVFLPPPRDPAFSPVPWPERRPDRPVSRVPSVIPPKDIYGYETEHGTYPPPQPAPVTPKRKHKRGDESANNRRDKHSDRDRAKSKDKPKNREKSKDKNRDRPRSKERHKDKEKEKDRPHKSEKDRSKQKDREKDREKDRAKKHKRKEKNGIMEGTLNAAMSAAVPADIVAPAATQLPLGRRRHNGKENIPVMTPEAVPIAVPIPTPSAPLASAQAPESIFSKPKKLFAKFPRISSKFQEPPQPQPPPPQPQPELPPVPAQPVLVPQSKETKHTHREDNGDPEHSRHRHHHHHHRHRHRDPSTGDKIDSGKTDEKNVRHRTAEEEAEYRRKKAAKKGKEKSKEAKDGENHRHREELGEGKAEHSSKHRRHKDKEKEGKERPEKGTEQIRENENRETKRLKKKSRSENENLENTKDKEQSRDKRRGKDKASKSREKDKDKDKDTERKSKTHKHRHKDKDKGETEEERRQRREAKKQRKHETHLKDGVATTTTTAANGVPLVIVQDLNDHRPVENSNNFGPPALLNYPIPLVQELDNRDSLEIPHALGPPIPLKYPNSPPLAPQTPNSIPHQELLHNGREAQPVDSTIPPAVDIPDLPELGDNELPALGVEKESVVVDEEHHRAMDSTLGEAAPHERSTPQDKGVPDGKGNNIEGGQHSQGVTSSVDVASLPSHSGEVNIAAVDTKSTQPQAALDISPLQVVDVLSSALQQTPVPPESIPHDIPQPDVDGQLEEQVPGAFGDTPREPDSVAAAIAGSHASGETPRAVTAQQEFAETAENPTPSGSVVSNLQAVPEPSPESLIVPPVPHVVPLAASRFLEHQASLPEVVPSDEKIVVTVEEIGLGGSSTAGNKRRSTSRRNTDATPERKEERRRRRAAEKAGSDNDISLPPHPIVPPEEVEAARRRKAHRAAEPSSLAPVPTVAPEEVHADKRKSKTHRSEEERRLRREQRKLERAAAKEQSASMLPTSQFLPDVYPRYDNRPTQSQPSHWAGVSLERKNLPNQSAYEEMHRNQTPIGLHGPPDPGYGHYGYGVGSGNGNWSGEEQPMRRRPRHRKSVTIDEVIREEGPGYGRDGRDQLRERERERERQRKDKERERERERERMAEAASNWTGNQSQVTNEKANQGQQKTGGRFGGSKFGNFFSLKRSFSKLFSGSKEKGPTLTV